MNVNRQLNMKKYKFKHSVEGIDRRSNLSLQEYYDVYDSKWSVKGRGGQAIRWK